jgi:Tol biopolymer transport system component
VHELLPGDAAGRIVGGAPDGAPAPPAPYRDCAPARLPDGRVVFVSDRDGNPEIYVAAPDGRVARLTRDAPGAEAVDAEPAPLGRDAIIFVRGEPGDADGAPADLYLMTLDGAPPRRLTRHPADDRTPAATADGRGVLFASDRGGRPAVYRLADAWAPEPESAVRLLAEDARQPAALADGSFVAVRTMRDGVPHLFQASASGGGRQVTDSLTLPFGASEPVALDDDRILFTSGPVGGMGEAEGAGPRSAVYRIALGGINLARVTRERAVYSDRARGLGVCR